MFITVYKHMFFTLVYSTVTSHIVAEIVQ